MKILAFSGISFVHSVLETLIPLHDAEKPDIITILGGLFPKQNKEEISNKKSNRKNTHINEFIDNILQLNIIGKPIFIVPNNEDIMFPKAINRLKKKEDIWTRWIHNKGSIIEIKTKSMTIFLNLV
ncbi:MAG: hypothetical protein ACXAC7_13030 [Candidatus Hodarchaeales archaeon]